ncbi:MAG: beta-ketoacyl synthase N-terminal-like domain-containing protein, partial [Candidatus Eremiobacterota bacterium]
MARSSIAIIGMACRFPDAPDPRTLWRNILARTTSFRPIDRWNHRLFAEAPPEDPCYTPCRRAAHLEDVASFARERFGISARRAQRMDPQQRLALEVAFEALDDAGLHRRDYSREGSAVFLGASVCEYSH